MTKKDQFLLTKDLSSLSDEERAQHLVNVCEAAGLDPRLGLLKYTMMEKGDNSGSRHLVLYASKGATNAIRGIKKISVVGLNHAVVGGVVVFTATAQDETGRIDMASGAADIAGKTGANLANAFAIAQTRASRRVTLQMAGLDLLDESEISGGTVSIESASVPLSEIGQPVEVSDVAGEDITNLVIKTPPGKPSVITALPVTKVPVEPGAPAADLRTAEVMKTEFHVQVPPHVGENVVVKSEGREDIEVKLPNPAAGMKVNHNAAMPGPDGAPPEGKKRGRKKREPKAEQPTPSPVAPAVMGTTAEAPTPAPVAEVSEPAPEAKAEPAKVMIGNMPNAEQMKQYVDKLTAYRTDILPNAGGMVASEDGMGVSKKIRKFFQIANPGAEDLSKLTVEQWENTFNFMDNIVKTQGAKALVKTIEYNLGGADASKPAAV